MKVLLVNSVCGSGSTGKICVDLYDELKKMEHECVIAYGRGDANSNYNTYRIGSKLNNYIDGCKSRVFDNQGFNSKNPTKKFIRYIKEYKPDIIHLHNLHGYYLNIDILFTFLKNEFKGKVIWTFHDCWPFLPRSAYLSDLEKYEYLPEIEPKSSIKNYPKSFIFNNSKNQYKRKKDLFSNIPNLTIVTPSLWLSNLVKKSFLGVYNIIVINNGINLDIFKPMYEKKIYEKKILGVANLWDKRKGLEYFNELSEVLPHEYTITLVGKIPKNEHLNSRIKHISQTKNQEELRDIYNDSDIYVNPTMIDNYPTTNLEALACNTPIIVFDTGGNKEMIINGFGCVTAHKNARSIEEVIYYIEQKLFEDSDFLISNEQRYKLSREYMIKNYIDLYN